jgi:hypothetical protein
MQNRINIDHTHSRAIAQEIGERLRAYLRDEPELPATFRMQINRLRELEGQSPLTMKRRVGNEPHKDVSRGDRWQLSWNRWRTIAMRYFAAIAIVVAGSGLAVHSVVSLPPQKQSTPTVAQLAARLAQSVNAFLLQSGG